MIEGELAFNTSPAGADGPAPRTGVPARKAEGPVGEKSSPPSGRLAPLDTIQISPEATERTAAAANALSDEEKAEVAHLKRQDAETRRHEQAHANAGGPYSGAPSYTYERGPDGHSYAVAGKTPIDTSPVSGDPAGTVQKMETVKRAALAPAEPSAQDRKVAAQADAEKRKAQAELTAQRAGEYSNVPEPRQNNAGAVLAAYGGGTGQTAASPLLELIV